MSDAQLVKRVNSFIARAQQEEINLHGFCLSVDGVEKVSAYYAPFAPGQPHRMYSVSKTFTGLAIGMLAEEGRLSLSDPLCRYFPEWAGDRPHPFLEQTLIEDLLCMASCHRETTYKKQTDHCWARTFFTVAPDHAPGMVFSYDTSASQVLGALVEKLTGKGLLDFLNERLFRPLGATDYKYWLQDPSGAAIGGSGLCLSLRDLHKTGQCLLDGGRGLVPGWYVQKMGLKHIETPLAVLPEEQLGYGWQCWRTRAGYAMVGMGSQLCLILPAKKAVFSVIADTRLDPNGHQRIYDAFFEELYPFLGEEDMPPAVLTLKALALKDRAVFAQSPAGVYRFGENPLRLKSLRLEGDCLIYEREDGEMVLPFTRGDTRLIPFPGHADTPAIAEAGWAADGLLRLRCHAVGHAPCGFELLLRFARQQVTVQARCSQDPLTEDYSGIASGAL